MSKSKILFFFLVCIVANATDTSAQSRKHHDIIKRYTDSLNIIRENTFNPQEESDTILNPYFMNIIGPATYMSRPSHEAFELRSSSSDKKGIRTYDMSLRDKIDSMSNAYLFKLYSLSPSSFSSYEQRFLDESIVDNATPKDNEKELAAILDNANTLTDVADATGNVEVDLKVVKPNFWKKTGNFSFQFTQNYISENWYKGGNNNETMLSSISLEALYDNQDKIQWDNKLELKLGFVTTTGDSIHNYLTNNDKIYALSKLGIKATKSWYYTVSLEAQTQFLPSYRTNDRKKYGNFIAPFDFYASVGMDYKPTLKNNNTLSIAILPLSYKMRYISCDNENIHSVYNMVGRHFRQDFGSKLELNATINLMKNLTWKSRFYYFTSYEYAESELENTLDFKFSKYISSQIYTLWRFDDNRSRDYYDRNLGYFQFKEYLTFGLSYNF